MNGIKRRIIIPTVLALVLVGATLAALMPYLRWFGMRPDLVTDRTGGPQIPFWSVVAGVAQFAVGLLAAIYWRQKRLFISALAGLFCAACVVAWYTSYRGWIAFGGNVERITPAHLREFLPVEVDVQGGGVMFRYFPQRKILKPDSKQLDPSFVNPNPNPGVWCSYTNFAAPMPYPEAPPDHRISNWSVLGFGYCRFFLTGTSRDKCLALIAPLWFLTLISALLASWWPIRFWRHRRDFAPGHCQKCGYDLRAHKPGEKCPECGSPIPVEASEKAS